MANDDTIAARGGLLPVGFPYGNFVKNWYRLTTSAVAVYLGQPMDIDANGQAIPAGATTSGTAFIAGPVVGFADDQFTTATAGGDLPSAMLDLTKASFLPALTNAWVCIADDPSQLFQMQADTAATLNTSNLMDNTTFAFRSSSGNTLTGYSTAEVSSIQAGIVGSGNLQIVGVIPYVNSDGSRNSIGQYAKLRVRILNHRFGFSGANNVGI